MQFDSLVHKSKQETLESVAFAGGTLDCVQEGDDVYVSLRRACENIGIDYKSQHRKVQDKEWATMVMITAVGKDGKKRDMTMIHLESLPMWLATIETGRVSEDVKPTLIKYQKECARVLKEHFFGNTSPISKAKRELNMALNRKSNIEQKIKDLNKTLNNINGVVERLVREVLEEEKRRLVRKAGINFNEPLQLDTEVPPENLKRVFAKRVGRLAHLKYGEEPTSEQFMYTRSDIYSSWESRYNKYLNSAARDYDTKIDYFEDNGNLGDLIGVADELIRELE